MTRRKTKVIEVKYPADVITPEQRAAYDATRVKSKRSVNKRVSKKVARRVSASAYPAYALTDAQRAYYDQYDKRYSLRGVDEVEFFAPLPDETEADRQSRLQAYPGILPGEAEPNRLIRLAAAEKEAFDTRPLEASELIWLRKNVIV